ncbi:hypothetical protein DV736_g4080, partial [Chaetothyriales sp. CBS 134916]
MALLRLYSGLLLALLLVVVTPSYAFIPDDAESPHAKTSAPTAAAAAGHVLLEERQGGVVNGPAAAAPSQVSPVTTYNINSYTTGGQIVPATVVYTQTFADVPDQWPSPSAGTIGLGTITGQVGILRTTH